jgi:hypothetical protein
MRNRNRLLGAALTAIVLASIGCGDVGADNADADAAITGGRGGGAGTSSGGSGGSQAGRGGAAGIAGGSSDASSESRTDVQVDARVDTSVDTSVDISDARLDVSIDVADARGDLSSDGAGGAGGGDASDTGAAGKSGAAGAGAAGASGAGGSAGGTMDAGDVGGATGIDASEDASDGAVDAGGGPDGPGVINEGGRDAPTTTTEAILLAASPDCLACAQDGALSGPDCDLNALKCENFTDLAQKLNCLDTLACVLPPGAATSCVKMPDVNVTICYCGTVPTADCLAGSQDGGVYGACKGYIDVGFPGQTPSFIGSNISNVNYSSGRAMKIAQCMGDLLNATGDQRCATCF